MTVIFTTPRTLVRPFTADDRAEYTALVSDPRVMEWEYNPPYTAEEAAQELAELIALTPEAIDDWNEYAVVSTASGRAIGSVAYHFNSKHHSAEIGYHLLFDHWGRGLGTELARGLTRHLIGRGAHRIFAIIETRNHPSIRVVEKAGFRREAHLIENVWVKGEWQSEYIYALLAREFVDQP